MSEVQPIRDKKKIKAMASVLKDMNEKYYILFLLGVQTGLRVSDIVTKKVSDIDMMSSKKIKEQKTGKKRFLYLNPESEKIIRKYIKDNNLGPDDYLIPSRRSDGHGKYQGCITPTQAYRVIKEAGESVGLYNIGTHTMRKTFGYHYYKQTHDVVPLMHIFNHSSQSITLQYIGIDTEEIQNSLDNFFLL